MARVRYSSIVRRILVTAAIICSLLWAVTGVSVLAVALHEHHHHETHDHHDAIEVVLHGHSHEGSPDHDHELTAPLSAARSHVPVPVGAVVSQLYEPVAAQIDGVRARIGNRLEGRDLGPPTFLLLCVSLT
jgi:ABC-type Zn2+ transport system substrate-binding protein/surface adhesin